MGPLRIGETINDLKLTFEVNIATIADHAIENVLKFFSTSLLQRQS